jgi:N4-gp56 family major capsid protein
MNTTGNVAMDANTQTYYDQRIRHVAEPMLPHRLLGVQGTIPANMGNQIIYPRMGAKPTVKTTMVEGVTPAPGSANLDKVVGTCDQIGYWEGHSDLLELTIGSGFLQAQNTAMGHQSARSIDWRTCQDLSQGTSVLRAGNRATRDAITASDVAVLSDVKLISTMMANVNAMRFMAAGNRFVGFIHPNVKHDLTSDPLWEDMVKKNPNPEAEKQFRGFYLGDAYGVSWVESTETRVFEGEGAAGINVYSTQIVAQGFYGWHSLQDLVFIAKQRGSAGTGDPLDQRSTTGWKTAFGTKIIFDQYGVRYETASSLG